MKKDTNKVEYIRQTYTKHKKWDNDKVETEMGPQHKTPKWDTRELTIKWDTRHTKIVN